MNKTGNTREETCFVLAPETLGLRTNLKKFKWSYGIDAPASDAAAFTRCAVKLALQVEPTRLLLPMVKEGTTERTGKYHYFSGTPGGDRLIYHRTLIGRTPLLIIAEGLLANDLRISVNRPY